MQAFFSGFALSFSLILAIGAQNAFVLRQGLRGEHVLVVCLICAVSDAILIAVGVFGFASLAAQIPFFETIMRWGGAVFLFWYGATNLWSAWKGGQRLSADQMAPEQLSRIVVTLLAITWLNPHVYLDTVVLIGSVSAQYENRTAFASGAVLASGVFFLMLGYGARLLAPIFMKAAAWRILDLVIGLTMWAIAASLIF